VSYAEHGWPVLPGSAWNSRRHVIPGTFKVTDGPRPLVARNLASTDVETVTRWWSAHTHLEPSVLLRSGEAFNLVSVTFELAQATIATMAAHTQTGPVLYRPDQRRAYFLVQCGPLLPGQFGKPGAVIAITPGEWTVAPPSRTDNQAHVQWWSTPKSTGWQPTDLAVLAEMLTLARRSQATTTTPHTQREARR
jgi:hypothetical protein